MGFSDNVLHIQAELQKYHSQVSSINIWTQIQIYLGSIKRLLSIFNTYMVEMQTFFLKILGHQLKNYSTQDSCQLMCLMAYVKPALYQDNPAGKI